MDKPQHEDAPAAAVVPPQATHRAAPRTSLARWSRLCVKELRETLRDRRTIVTLVLMPLLVYPLLSMIFNNFLLSSASSLTKIDCIIAADSERSLQRLQQLVQLGERVLIQRGELQPTGTEDGPGDLWQVGGVIEPSIRWRFGENLRRQVTEGGVDVAVYLTALPPEETQPNNSSGRPGQAERRIPSLRFQVFYRKESALSEAGLDFLTRRLQAVNEQYLIERLMEAGVRPTLPVVLDEQGVEQTGSEFSLTTIVPLILILMTITGAVYPAIDLTAGERERGTLETLMAAPVPRLGLLSAKYVAVLVVALFTATANLVAMTITLVATGLGPLVFGDSGPPPVLVSAVFALLILFAAFFSAILLALTSFARSFKEAQAYLIPVMLLSLAPGIVSLMPDLEFNGVLAVTPLVNIVLLARDILEGNADGVLAAAAVLSTALYAVAALTVAARVFGTDAILYGGEGGWSDLWVRPEHPRSQATVAGAMLSLAVLFPVYFLLSNFLQQATDASMAIRLCFSALVTALLFAGLPIVAALLQRVRFRSGFGLQPTGPLAFLAALVLGLSLWPLAHELFLLNRFLGLGVLGSDKLEAVEQMLAQWRAIPPWLILLTLAVTPAVCEEFFFRGYLLSALRPVMRPWKAIVVSGLLFGVFHVITTSVLSVERLLPSTMMGLVLGWVCVRTGSVLPGMLLHATHNGLLLMIAYYREVLIERGWGVEEQMHLPFTWIAASVLFVLVGGAILVAATRRNRRPADPSGHHESPAHAES